MRVALLIVLLVSVAGPAAAWSPPRTEYLAWTTDGLSPSIGAGPVAVGPDGLEGPDDPYIVSITLATPEVPHSGSAASDDCSLADRPADPADAVERLVLPGLDTILGEVPQPDTSLVGIVPPCIATPTSCLLAACPLYASYDVATGRYYVEPHAPIGLHLDDPPFTGTTGTKVQLDCVGCPPPECCPLSPPPPPPGG